MQGSDGITCDDNGRCTCKAYVINDKCDTCASGLDNFPVCDTCAAGYFNYPTCEGKHYLHIFLHK